jgi:hypothetical protein
MARPLSPERVLARVKRAEEERLASEAGGRASTAPGNDDEIPDGDVRRALSTDVRRCYRCRLERPEAAFIRKRNGGLYQMCSPCLTEVLSGRDVAQKKVRLPHTAVDRVCYLCRRRLPNAEFTKRSNGTSFVSVRRTPSLTGRSRGATWLVDGRRASRGWRA